LDEAAGRVDEHCGAKESHAEGEFQARSMNRRASRHELSVKFA
jgi:hypothetical protein